MTAMQGAQRGESEAVAVPCFREMQVFGVVGHDDVRADVAAGHALGETWVCCVRRWPALP